MPEPPLPSPSPGWTRTRAPCLQTLARTADLAAQRLRGSQLLRAVSPRSREQIAAAACRDSTAPQNCATPALSPFASPSPRSHLRPFDICNSPSLRERRPASAPLAVPAPANAALELTHCDDCCSRHA